MKHAINDTVECCSSVRRFSLKCVKQVHSETETETKALLNKRNMANCETFKMFLRKRIHVDMAKLQLWNFKCELFYYVAGYL